MAYAVVTGASSGIGKELAKLCAKSGYDLVLIARSREPLEALADEIQKDFRRHSIVIPKDLSRLGAAIELYNETEAVRGDIHILINNAGFGVQGLFIESDLSRQMEMLYLNCGALTELTHLFGKDMSARRDGYILNVASTAAFQPGPLMAVYYASKAYVLSFSSALHNEMKDFGVAVTALCPGPTLTEFQNRAGVASSSLFKGPNVMTASDVAAIGFKGLMKRKPFVIPGRLNATMAFLTRFAPRQFTATMARKVQET